MEVIKGAFVTLDIIEGDQDVRTIWIQDIYNWVRLNIAHKFDSYIIRKGIHVDHQLVWSGSTIGDVVEEKWIWFFEDVGEALRFKMTFVGVNSRPGM